ncbi:hypothetical protein [Sinorhizobium terangae]|uniref:hypothetical protein n=1 Tax=Sinorhizobium terangae TaxID=110322 RepID=UPI0024B2547A|nr:hypothetical protein [Sinorhizobium terangae]WFU49152.1 hypothetical protein QA637_07070 [Sinorhizobium terangae]
MRRRRRESSIEVLYWLDDHGNRVEDVDDRFNSRFMMHDSMLGDTWVAEKTIAESGVAIFTLKDIVTLGFTTEEFNAMMRVLRDSDFEECVSTEEELDELMTPAPGRLLR